MGRLTKEEYLKTKVYAFLDPRKPGKYEYVFKGGVYRPKFEPFYIGSSKYDHLYRHLCGTRTNRFMIKKINKIRKEGYDPIVTILKCYNQRHKALKLESALILSIGRADIETGTLLNLTNGGIGPSHLNDETKKKMGKLIKIKNAGEKNPFYGKHHTKKSKEKMSKFQKIRFSNQEEIEKLRKKALRKNLSEETLTKMRDSQKKRFSDKKNHPLYGKRKVVRKGKIFWEKV